MLLTEQDATSHTYILSLDSKVSAYKIEVVFRLIAMIWYLKWQQKKRGGSYFRCGKEEGEIRTKIMTLISKK